MYDRPAGGVKLGWPYKKHFCGTFYDESMLLAENAKILCCHIFTWSVAGMDNTVFE